MSLLVQPAFLESEPQVARGRGRSPTKVFRSVTIKNCYFAPRDPLLSRGSAPHPCNPGPAAESADFIRVIALVCDPGVQSTLRSPIIHQRKRGLGLGAARPTFRPCLPARCGRGRETQQPFMRSSPGTINWMGASFFLALWVESSMEGTFAALAISFPCRDTRRQSTL